MTIASANAATIIIRTTETLNVAGRDVPVRNLQKVLYPGRRFTKAQVIDYYIRAAPYLLPHLRDRPVTLKRHLDGVTGEAFYEKVEIHVPLNTPVSYAVTQPFARALAEVLATRYPKLMISEMAKQKRKGKGFH